MRNARIYHFQSTAFILSYRLLLTIFNNHVLSRSLYGVYSSSSTLSGLINSQTQYLVIHLHIDAKRKTYHPHTRSSHSPKTHICDWISHLSTLLNKCLLRLEHDFQWSVQEKYFDPPGRPEESVSPSPMAKQGKPDWPTCSLKDFTLWPMINAIYLSTSCWYLRLGFENAQKNVHQSREVFVRALAFDSNRMCGMVGVSSVIGRSN